MLVVKVGGSLYNTPELKQWLDLLTKSARHHKIIIVPGGGPFADIVRDAQKEVHFSDSAAHHMALLAMAQYGILLNSIAPQSELFYYSEQSPQLADTGLSIWLPTEQLLTNESIPHEWDVTSDSLSLWLAQQINADQLCLIKRIRARSCAISELIESNIIDNAFSYFYSQKPIESYIQYYQDFASFALSQKYPKRLSL